MRVVSWDVGLRTLSYCTLEGTWGGAEVAVRVQQWDSIDVQTDEASAPSVGAARGAASVSKRAKGETISVERGAELMMETLHRRAHLFDGVDAIVIEQQPAGGHNRQGNVRMKVMSHAIQCYFYTRALLHGGAMPVITFVSPASKLVDMQRTPKDEEAGEGEGSKKQYKQNKQFAIAKTGELLQTVLKESTDAVSLFQSSNLGKKDDLADSLLLGYYYLLKEVARAARQTVRDSKAAEKEAKAAAKETRIAERKAKAAEKEAKAAERAAVKEAKRSAPPAEKKPRKKARADSNIE